MAHHRRGGRYRAPAVIRLGYVLLVVLVLSAVGFSSLADPAAAASPVAAEGRAAWRHLAGTPGTPGPGGDPSRTTLVLYDDTGPTPEVGMSYGLQSANLVSRGGAYRLEPVAEYRRGQAAKYTGLVYVGSSGAELPAAFLSDVAAERTPPVVWIGDGIGQLYETYPSLEARWGWRPNGDATSTPVGIEYKSHVLQRDPRAGAQITGIDVPPGSRASVLASAIASDQSKSPYAVRSGSVTYVADLPYDYVGVSDRYLAVADLLREVAAPSVPDRRRALVRLEDVGPTADPAQLREIADYLSSIHVPFTVAVYPHYLDPSGAENSGRPTSLWLADRPRVVDALRYMTEHGGTLLLHGVTHQYREELNPYNAVSGADFEFYLAHVDEENYVRLGGPVPEDSPGWASDRIQSGRGEFSRVGLPAPTMFEFPHYAGSAADYRVVDQIFGVRYDQGTYFSGPCTPGACTDRSSRVTQQYFPFAVRDVYGSVVVPENLGNIAPEAYNNNAPRLPGDLVSAARDMLVVRDGVASFFYHPFLGVDRLRQTVEGITALGYRFVPAEEIATEPYEAKSPSPFPLGRPLDLSPLPYIARNEQMAE